MHKEMIGGTGRCLVGQDQSWFLGVSPHCPVLVHRFCPKISGLKAQGLTSQGLGGGIIASSTLELSREVRRGMWQIHLEFVVSSKAKADLRPQALGQSLLLLPAGLRGLQIYRLHREPIPNNRLKCQQWLESQPQWPSWNWNQIACPCTWQQGRWDLRFRPVSSGDTFLSPSSLPTNPSAHVSPVLSEATPASLPETPPLSHPRHSTAWT